MDWSDNLVQFSIALISTTLGTIIATWATRNPTPVNTPPAAAPPQNPQQNGPQTQNVSAGGDAYNAGGALNVDQSINNNFHTTINNANQAAPNGSDSTDQTVVYLVLILVASITTVFFATKYLDYVLAATVGLTLGLIFSSVIFAARSRYVWGGLPTSARWVIVADVVLVIGLVAVWTATFTTNVFGWTIWDIEQELRGPALGTTFFPWRDLLDRVGGEGAYLLGFVVFGIVLSEWALIWVAILTVLWAGGLRQTHPK